MTLFDLAFACFLYGRFTDYDRSYLLFLDATDHSPDLANFAHLQALLRWLNEWGCRQFAVEYHEHASAQIISWYKQFRTSLFSAHSRLWEISRAELDSVGVAYDALSKRIASYRARKGHAIPISFGPTGAAKVLFAIRPHALPPWDAPIRRGLGYDTSQASYVSYLLHVKSILEELADACQRNGFELTDLPRQVGRPSSTVPKLIDEYYWVILTKKCSSPDAVTFQRWIRWSQP